MLAAATGTGDWIVGGIALVVGLAIIVGIVWLLWRLVTWPFRRHRRGPSGLGSEYEQMIQQQQRGRRGNPPSYPLPPDWQQRLGQPQTAAAMPGQSRVVLPPPPYRAREP